MAFQEFRRLLTQVPPFISMNGVRLLLAGVGLDRGLTYQLDVLELIVIRDQENGRTGKTKLDFCLPFFLPLLCS